MATPTASSAPRPTPPPGRYLVTGAGGFIGAHLCQRLLDAGREVVAADLTSPTNLHNGTTFVRLDLRDRQSVRRAVSHSGATHAVHLAAKVGDWGPREHFDAVNVAGTRAVLEALRGSGVGRAVHLSSIASMGLDAGAVADESVAPITDGDAYSATKAGGERVAREFQAQGAPLAVIRPGDVYGIGSVPWVLRPLDLLKRRQMMLVDGGLGHFAHVHVDNLVDLIVLALTDARAVGEVFIGTDGDQRCTIGSYFTRLAEVTGLPRPSLSVSERNARRLAGVVEAVCKRTSLTPPITQNAVSFVLRKGSFSNGKARELLGWTPRVTLSEGLTEIGAHYSPRVR